MDRTVLSGLENAVDGGDFAPPSPALRPTPFDCQDERAGTNSRKSPRLIFNDRGNLQNEKQSKEDVRGETALKCGNAFKRRGSRTPCWKLRFPLLCRRQVYSKL